jgi:hypothetical protein
MPRLYPLRLSGRLTLLSTVIAQRVSDDSWMEDAEPSDPNAIPGCLVFFVIGYGIFALAQRIKTRLARTFAGPGTSVSWPNAQSNPRLEVRGHTPPRGVQRVVSPLTSEGIAKSNAPLSSSTRPRPSKARSAANPRARKDAGGNRSTDSKDSARGKRKNQATKDPLGERGGAKAGGTSKGKKAKPSAKPKRPSKSKKKSDSKSQPSRKPTRSQKRKRLDP